MSAFSISFHVHPVDRFEPDVRFYPKKDGEPTPEFTKINLDVIHPEGSHDEIGIMIHGDPLRAAAFVEKLRTVFTEARLKQAGIPSQEHDPLVCSECGSEKVYELVSMNMNDSSDFRGDDGEWPWCDDCERNTRVVRKSELAGQVREEAEGGK